MSVVIDVDRSNLSVSRLNRTPSRPLADGEARLAIDAFALTANNITYAVFGDGLRYWDFFPVGEGSWGRVPVWGFADVVESKSALEVGQRFYGYLPMGTELVVQAGRVDARGFTDLAEHRSPMAAAYNRYSNTAADPTYRADREAHQMVLWPLFMTSFMIDDFLGQSVLSDPEVTTVVVSSASSKTAIGAAFLAALRPDIHVVGVTSKGNASFVKDLGCYSSVVTYDEVAQGSASWPEGRAAYVDIAGDQAVTGGVHRIFEDDLAYSMVVGGTHWSAPRGEGALPGPKPEFFFAPSQIALRTKEWGREGLDQRVGDAWDRFASWSNGWLRFETTQGAEDVERLYGEMLAGRVDPRVGHVCRMS